MNLETELKNLHTLETLLDVKKKCIIEKETNNTFNEKTLLLQKQAHLNTIESIKLTLSKNIRHFQENVISIEEDLLYDDIPKYNLDEIILKINNYKTNSCELNKYINDLSEIIKQNKEKYQNYINNLDTELNKITEITNLKTNDYQKENQSIINNISVIKNQIDLVSKENKSVKTIFNKKTSNYIDSIIYNKKKYQQNIKLIKSQIKDDEYRLIEITDTYNTNKNAIIQKKIISKEEHSNKLKLLEFDLNNHKDDNLLLETDIKYITNNIKILKNINNINSKKLYNLNKTKLKNLEDDSFSINEKIVYIIDDIDNLKNRQKEHQNSFLEKLSELDLEYNRETIEIDKKIAILNDNINLENNKNISRNSDLIVDNQTSNNDSLNTISELSIQKNILLSSLVKKDKDFKKVLSVLEEDRLLLIKNGEHDITNIEVIIKNDELKITKFRDELKSINSNLVILNREKNDIQYQISDYETKRGDLIKEKDVLYTKISKLQDRYHLLNNKMKTETNSLNDIFRDEKFNNQSRNISELLEITKLEETINIKKELIYKLENK